MRKSFAMVLLGTLVLNSCFQFSGVLHAQTADNKKETEMTDTQMIRENDKEAQGNEKADAGEKPDNGEKAGADEKPDNGEKAGADEKSENEKRADAEEKEEKEEKEDADVKQEMKPEAVSQSEANEQLEDRIKNGCFDEDLSYWNSFTTADGEADFVNQAQCFKAGIKKTGTEAYSVATVSNIFKLLKKGKYRIEFEVSSTTPRKINCCVQMSNAPYTGYFYEAVQADTTPKKIVREFTMEEANDPFACLTFQMGKISEETPDEIHDVTIDNVHLYVLDESQCQEDEKKDTVKKVTVNQLGYKPGDKKIAVFAGDMNSTTFDVVSAESGEVVYSGQIYGKMSNASTQQSNSFGDFSAVTSPGKYKIVLHTDSETKDPLQESYSFTIGEHIYDDAFKDAVRFFYLQRCGMELSQNLAGDFAHPACHMTLGRIYGTDKKIDVSGGWHDAGDYGRYVVASASTIGSLLNAYNDNKAAFGDDLNILESGNGIPDLLDEVKLELDWLFKMQAENGGVYHKATCAHFPGMDVMPQDETDEIIVCPVTTTATGDFAAVMAMGYEEFKKIDPAYADKCLAAAEKAWDYLEKQPAGGAGPNLPGIESGAYEDMHDHDERFWAAAQLFKATGNPKYNKAACKLAGEELSNEYSWADVGIFGSLAYMKAEGADPGVVGNIKNSILDSANSLLALSQNDGYGVSMNGQYHWGSNSQVAGKALILCFANDISPNSQYIDFAKEHINYLLGKNANAISYLTGYGENATKNPHHRPSVAQKKAIPGMLAGGPNMDHQDPVVAALRQDAAPAMCYVDSLESYSSNEVDIYWNAPFVYALAKLEQ